MEILGVRAGMSSELKQTRPSVGVTAEMRGGGKGRVTGV
jgi:hypothetical protein